MLSAFLDFVNTALFGPGLCIAVLCCGVYLMLRLGLFFVTKPKKMAKALTSGGTGEASPVRAMVVALAGTLGVGNIAGVASAIAIGGAGAIFWMWVSAIAALPIKYAEIVLAVRHRRRDSSGVYHGGAHFYIADSGSRTAKAAAAGFALLCIGASLAMGSAVQANAIAVSLSDTFRVNPQTCGIILAAVTLFVIAGGLRRISAMTFRLIPLMSGLYILMCVYIMVRNHSLLWEITAEIVGDALSAEAFGGGIAGFLTSRALRMGVTRGIVSNEAGCGTAPIAHAAAKVEHPAEQGVWGIFEVFLDTIVICTLTAYVVLISHRHGITLSADGMTTAARALGAFIPHADVILCAAVLVFAFCTIICWFHYGAESLAALSHRPAIRRLYALLYAASAGFGCIISGGIVWSLADLFISAMTAVNIVAILLRVKEIKSETDNYFGKSSCKFGNKPIPKLHFSVAKSRKMW